MRQGKHAADCASAAKNSYLDGLTDEFIEPTVIGNGHALASDDAVIFVNYRTDRPRQLCQALVQKDFNGFTRTPLPGLFLCTMTNYQVDLPVDAIVFGPVNVEGALAEVLSKVGLSQLHASESEKRPHVTYFFNGGREEAWPKEERLIIDSPHVATYDLEPAMSAMELTQAVITRILEGRFDFILINYANPDMVAHSGAIDPTILAVETTDACIGALWTAVEATGGAILVTSDHGNAEVLLTPDGEIDTEHNPSDVPLIALGSSLPGGLKPGVLASVAPTLLRLLELPIPADMTAESLWT